jgi:hypothetical protein
MEAATGFSTGYSHFQRLARNQTMRVEAPSKDSDLQYHDSSKGGGLSMSNIDVKSHGVWSLESRGTFAYTTAEMLPQAS